MKKYEGQSDEELLLQMRQGETDVAEYLVKKYKYLVLRQGPCDVSGRGRHR